MRCVSSGRQRLLAHDGHGTATHVITMCPPRASQEARSAVSTLSTMQTPRTPLLALSPRLRC